MKPFEQQGDSRHNPRLAFALVGCLILAASGGTTPISATPVEAQTNAIDNARALVDQYCVTCHNQTARTSDLALDVLDLENVPEDAAIWEQVIRKVGGGMMPPVDARRPDDTNLDEFVSFLRTSIDTAAADTPDAGRTVLHRLNRAEYANAVRDLLDLQIDPAAMLPADEQAYGFDNIADVLGVSPSLMDRYLSSAWKISSLAVGDTGVTPVTETIRVAGDLSQNDHVEGLPIGTRGGILIDYNFPVNAEYVFSPKLYRETVDIIRGLELPHELEITLDGRRVHLEEFGGPEDEEQAYLYPAAAGDQIEQRFQLRMHVPAGPHKIGVAFIKKSSATTVYLLEPFLRERVDPITPVGIPELDRVTIEGPFNVSGPGYSPSRQRIFSCYPDSETDAASCAESILSDLGRRAYRKTLTEAETERLLEFYRIERAKGNGFDTGIEAALTFMLVSPQFLFRFERDPENAQPETDYRVDDFELASRLSFFLWSSIPDDELLDLAANLRLRDPAVLEEQTRRMLADERARALGSNFAGQWLYLRNIRSLTPDPDIFYDFDDNLRQALQRETELLFESIVVEDRPVLELLDADYTFVNERLARHYGIPGIYGNQFRRIPVENEYRKGLLGHGSILALTSYPNRTSPVNRGKYVLTNILGTPPPEPPDNVPPLEENPAEASTMRERMVGHRSNPACSGCHQLMDPIGLALENFDGIGRWRTTEGGIPIDPSDTLADGTEVDGPVALREAILERSDQFVGTMTETLFTYALGRGLEHSDMPVVRGIIDESAPSDYRFSSLVLGIVNSVPFQMRKTASE